MNKKQYTGKTLEEALDKAARDFAIEKDLVCYNVLQQPSGGLLSRIFNRSIRFKESATSSLMDLFSKYFLCRCSSLSGWGSVAKIR
jgi:predicted RNA-binding protein Jag